jgi:hypothetical protein
MPRICAAGVAAAFCPVCRYSPCQAVGRNGNAGGTQPAARIPALAAAVRVNS